MTALSGANFRARATTTVSEVGGGPTNKIIARVRAGTRSVINLRNRVTAAARSGGKFENIYASTFERRSGR